MKITFNSIFILIIGISFFTIVNFDKNLDVIGKYLFSIVGIIITSISVTDILFGKKNEKNI